MKDPLQTEPTPYEVLGVECGASAAEIEAAFRQGLLKRGNVQKLTAAKLTLQRPAERALLDLLQYDSAVLARVTPNPLTQSGALDLAQRPSTAAAWERQFRAHFPDLGLAHCLSLLWYWWVTHEDEQENGTDCPGHLQRWQRALGCWGMVLASEEFWRGSSIVPAELVPGLRATLADRLRNQLHEAGQHVRTRGQIEDAGRYQELELAWATELRTAEDVAGAGLHTPHGRFACGRLLLQQLNLLDPVRSQVSTALAKSPTNKRLQSLMAALSPYSSLAVLIEHKKPQEALDAIKKLSPEERKTAEVKSLRVQALYELGKQQASLGDIDSALESWARALPQSVSMPPTCPTCKKLAKEEASPGSYWCSWCGQAFEPPEEAASGPLRSPGEGLQAQIYTEIVTTCQAQAATLQRRPREAAALLEKALRLVKDEKLELTLGEILAQAGIEAINDAQRLIESEKKGVTPEVTRAVEQALADLKRGAKLGSKRAAESIQAAENFLQSAKSGLLDIPSETAKLLRKANDEASAGHLSNAIDLMRKAVAAVEGRGQMAIKKQLAMLLNARAVQRVNTAMGNINFIMEAYQPKIQTKVKNFLEGRGNSEDQKGKSKAVVAWVIGGLFVAFCLIVGLTKGKAKFPKWAEEIGNLVILVFVLGPLITYIFGAITKAMKSMNSLLTPSLYGGGSSTPCKLCATAASYQFNLPGYGECALCSSHANTLQDIMKSTPDIDATDMSLLLSAGSDLEEAYGLDPNAEGVRENRQNVKEAIARFVKPVK